MAPAPGIAMCQGIVSFKDHKRRGMGSGLAWQHLIIGLHKFDF
jgi:hypothetical protein